MTYIFWQNILSIHQSSFIRHLAIDNAVLLISEIGITEERVVDGWAVPDFGNAEIIIDPDDKQINSFLNIESSVHIFTGINAFPMVTKVFKWAVKKKLKIGVQLEIFEFSGIKGYLRKFKYFLLQKKYGKRIDFLLVTGSYGCKAYEMVGFNKSKIFNWAYFTENKNFSDVIRSNIQMPNLIFVGRLDQNKNLLGILPIIIKHIAKIGLFTIVGDGVLKNEILDYTSEKIIYKGVLPNNKIHYEITNADILILPSFYDGWGAVVNEALMVGTKVLCSVNCGASDLIKGYRGKIFSYDKNNFESQFSKIIEEGIVSEDLRSKIREWSQDHISGKIAAEYFIRITKHIYHKTDRPSTPWI